MHKINHLYARAGFGLSATEWEEKQNWKVSKAVAHLFKEAKNAAPLPEEPYKVVDPRKMSDKEKAELRKVEVRKVFQMTTEWIERMASESESALLERMSLFWHGHFACRIRSSRLANQQLNSIRKHALGNFRDLVKAIARDPSMIRYLNNQQNKKRQPNENFARELMELFTIGIGNYSEEDIKEAARAFTGWSSNFNGEYVFRSFQHDYGRKTFMGKTGNFDGDEIIDIILERRETAKFITQKIYRYFVNEQIDEARVNELANYFYRNDYDIGKLMRTIFESKWFYKKENVGCKFKSPVEYMAGLMKHLNVNFELPASLLFAQRSLGQTLFNPPNVAGWPGGKTWIDNSSLMLRLNMGAYLLTSADIKFHTKEEFEAPKRSKASRRLKAEVNLNDLEKMTSKISDRELFDYLKNYLLLAETKANPMVFRRATSGVNTRTELLHRAMVFFTSLPEYQLC